MKHTERPIEKRSCNRLQPKDGAYAIIKYKPTIFGQIINISKNGLAVHYSSNGQQLSETSELDIFIEDSKFYIEKIQTKTIFDVEIADKLSVNSKKIRQRGFQFEEMKSSQLFQLDYFLENHTK